jgi:hypothetical protein
MKSQKDKILELLLEAYPNYITNFTLNKICFRYGGRIHELRRDGWKIENIPSKDNHQEWHCRLLQPFKSEKNNQLDLNL